MGGENSYQNRIESVRAARLSPPQPVAQVGPPRRPRPLQCTVSAPRAVACPNPLSSERQRRFERQHVLHQ